MAVQFGSLIISKNVNTLEAGLREKLQAAFNADSGIIEKIKQLEELPLLPCDVFISAIPAGNDQSMKLSVAILDEVTVPAHKVPLEADPKKPDKVFEEVRTFINDKFDSIINGTL